MRSEIHDSLTKMAQKWLYYKVTGKGLCWGLEVSISGVRYVPDAVALACLQHRFSEKYTGGHYRERIFVFDSKVTRADYFGSYPDRGITIGDLHWIVTPKELFEPNEVIEPWGILEVCGSGLREVKKPVWVESSLTRVHTVAHGILWANHHGPRREHMKRFRAYQREFS